MATQVELGVELTINVTFRDYSGNSSNGVVVDPDTPAAVKVYKSDVLILDDVSTKVSDGNYRFVWEPEETGVYRVDFIGDFTDGDATPSSYQVVITEDIAVNDATSELSPVSLGRTQEIVFATAIDPMFADPEDFTRHYPESNLVEAAELIHKYSVEISRIFEGKEIPQVAYDYLENAVLCALGSIYDAGMIGDGSSITLGDLSVSGGARFTGSLNRGNASNACERSFVLRQEMIRAAQGSKSVVKGSRSGGKKLPSRDIKTPHRRGERL